MVWQHLRHDHDTDGSRAVEAFVRLALFSLAGIAAGVAVFMFGRHLHWFWRLLPASAGVASVRAACTGKLKWFYPEVEGWRDLSMHAKVTLGVLGGVQAIVGLACLFAGEHQ